MINKEVVLVLFRYIKVYCVLEIDNMSNKYYNIQHITEHNRDNNILVAKYFDFHFSDKFSFITLWVTMEIGYVSVIKFDCG